MNWVSASRILWIVGIVCLAGFGGAELAGVQLLPFNATSVIGVVIFLAPAALAGTIARRKT